MAAEGKKVNIEGIGLEEHLEELIPDFTDDFTLINIVPKLRWKTLESLASVSPAWLHAIQCREVYNVRLLYRGVESLILLRCASAIGLYSTEDGFYFELPSLVDKGGIPADCECVVVDGKLYAMGGKDLDFCHVYVLDLAGPRLWRQCASMLQRKKYFNCVALGGKVYAFGIQTLSWSDDKTLRASEVYDPKENTWSPIEPVPYRTYHSIIRTVGEEAFVLSSKVAEDGFATMWDIYHAVKAEWRQENFSGPIDEDTSMLYLFAAQGKLYWMQFGDIFVMDMDTGRWTLRHHYTFAGVGSLDDSFVDTINVTPVGNELVALVRIRAMESSSEFWVLESEGFEGKNRDVTWHRSKICPSVPVTCFNCRLWKMYPIEL